MYVTVYNTTDAPVTVDFMGRVVGGGEWGVANTVDDEVKAALASGDLVQVGATADDASDVNPAARSAYDATTRASERATQAGALDSEALAKLLGDDGDGLTKTQLVHAVAVRQDVDIPAAKTSRATQQKES